MYQDWCVNTITDILSQHQPEVGTWDDVGYESVLKMLITHYADIYWSPNGWNRRTGGCQVNIWWDFNKKNFRRFFSPLLLSVDAKRLIQGSWEDNDDLKMRNHDDDPNDKIHFEHITPKSYLFKKLLAIQRDEVTAERVCDLLRLNKIVILTKQESQLLDGRGMKFETTDRDALSDLGLGHNECESEINEANRVLSSGHCHPRDTGSAFFRMCYLNRHGVEFTFLNESQLLPKDRWKEYFEGRIFELPGTDCQ